MRVFASIGSAEIMSRALVNLSHACLPLMTFTFTAVHDHNNGQGAVALGIL